MKEREDLLGARLANYLLDRLHILSGLVLDPKWPELAQQHEMHFRVICDVAQMVGVLNCHGGLYFNARIRAAAEKLGIEMPPPRTIEEVRSKELAAIAARKRRRERQHSLTETTRLFPLDAIG